MRFRLRTLFIVLFAFSLGFAGVAAYWHKFGGRLYYNRRIEAHLRQLDAKRPSTLTVAQWECLARSTRTLHSNSLLSFETSLADISDFEKRLD